MVVREKTSPYGKSTVPKKKGILLCLHIGKQLVSIALFGDALTWAMTGKRKNMEVGKMRAGFIGAGKVGCSLGLLFRKKGLPVVGYVSRHGESADLAATLTASHHFAALVELVAESDILFLTVPDGSIADVWKELQKCPLEGKLVCHCSGSLPAAVLEEAADICLGACSLHPLYAVSSREESWEGLSSAVFTLEGDSAAVATLYDWLLPAELQIQRLKSIDKTRYHAAAVFASNLVVGLVQEAWDLLEECGFDENTARLALAPLLSGNIAKLVEQGAEKALTGPMERNDVKTVARHLGVLKNDQREIYRLLSVRLLEIASRKHPERDMEAMREVLHC
mgnify:CR=1 FL=1